MHIPVIIGGGGIIGLLFYYELQKKFPALDCALLESSSFFGDMATGRNSGVLHAGLYYPEGSLKHQLCLEGNRLWDELSLELEVSLKRCGKFIVASSEDEREALAELYQKAKRNKVPLLRETTKEEEDELKKWCSYTDSFFSGSTGVLSPSEVIKNLVRKIESRGGILMKNHRIERVQELSEGEGRFLVSTDQGEFRCDTFVNACGGFAPEVRKGLGLNDFESYWVKGSYFKLNKSFYNDSLIYPVPPKDLLGLGVHTSFDLDGIIRFGPDTSSCEEYEHSLNEENMEGMFQAIQKVFKGIERSELSLDYCGIRAKIKRDGKLYPDFFIGNQREGYLEYLGLESPGLTSAPALVREGLRKLEIRG